MKRKKLINKIIFYVGLILILGIILFPFYIMFITSIKTNAEATASIPTLFPKTITFEHYQDIFNPEIFPFVKYFTNSFITSISTALISVIIGIFGAYALSKVDFKGRLVISNSFYVVYMFSGILLIVPLFKIISGLGLYDTLTSLVVTMVVQTLPTSIFMLKSYFDTIPHEIEEAARIDGLNKMQIILRITIPLAMSGILSVFVYAFMIAWNDYLFASIFLSSQGSFTLPIGLNTLFGTPDYIWGRMMAASLITALPVVLMYALSERFIKGGALDGGVKG